MIDLKIHEAALTSKMKDIIGNEFPDSTGTLQETTSITVTNDGTIRIRTTDYFKYVNEEHKLIEKFNNSDEFKKYITDYTLNLAEQILTNNE